jgi:hypothetical protein
MDKFCHSCTMPLKSDSAGDYCQYCVDETGKLKSYNEIHAGIAQWLESWSPKTVKTDARTRAEHFMKAMPAWADRK